MSKKRDLIPRVEGLPYGVVTVLAAIAEDKQLTPEGRTMADALTRPELGLAEATPGTTSGYRPTAAGRQRLAEVCNRCGRGLSPNGHCHPCIEDKLLMQTDPSTFLSMKNAFVE